MHLNTLVWREIAARRGQLATGLLAVVLGVAAVVGIHTVATHSEKAVKREMEALGANIMILPKSIGVQDYYSADMHNETLPEDYVGRIAMSGLKGVDNLSPKLSLPAEIPGSNFTLTGILPKSEFQAKAAWGGAGIFGQAVEGCAMVGVHGPTTAEGKARSLARTRVIQDLAADEALLGADVGQRTGVGADGRLTVRGREFRVVGVLPATGTIDDGRVFAHLHTVQELGGKGSVVNAIEVVGCCEAISQGLAGKLNTLLPEAKVVTINQVVSAQVSTNQLMHKLTLVFLAIIVVVGGAGIANAMYANVAERRREIATLMALGASRWQVSRIFLLKALVIGLLGGTGGYLLGTAGAAIAGPQVAAVPVLPLFWLIPVAVFGTAVIALLAAWPPSRRAAGIDPTLVFQEV
jgi:putative ABC transport system permease protein